MSKYTTEVRFICETASGLTESKGFNDVDTILNSAWNTIFTSNATVFGDRKAEVCKKVLKHYYTREIGAETVGLWKLWMNTKFEEILPYYNKMWESASFEFDPLDDINYRKQHYGASNASNTKQNTGTIGDAGTYGSTKYDLFSDTPQGSLSGVNNENYLTSAEKITDSQTSGNTRTLNTTQTDNGSSNNNYTDTINGKRGTKSYAKLLEEYRKTILNIDEMFIREFSDCFLGLW